MARNTQRTRKTSNNPEGRNQYSGWRETAKDRPITTAAAAAAAVGAGVFLWSRRNQISEQISSLSEQIGEWRDSMTSNEYDSGFDDTAETGAFVAKPKGKKSKTQSEIAEEALTLKQTGTAETVTV